MPTIDDKIVRMILHLGKKTDAVDINNDNKTPETWRGTDNKFQILISTDGTTAGMIDAAGDITKIKMTVLPINDRSGAPIHEEEIAVGAMDFTTDAASWDDGSKQHAEFTLSASETQFDFTGATDNKKSFWVVVHVERDSSTKFTTVQGTTWTVHEDGTQNGLPAIGTSGVNFKLRADGVFMFKDPVNGTFSPPFIDKSSGQRIIALGDETS